MIRRASASLPKPFDGSAQAIKAAVMTSRISHTSFDALDAYAQSVFWSQVLETASTWT
jgi:hypothetical protein